MEERQARFVARFAIIPDPRERLSAVVSRKVDRMQLPDCERLDEALVPGCVSRIWLVGEVVDEICRFRMAADSQIVGGLASALAEVCDGVGANEIADGKLDLLERLEFDRILSPTRWNGLDQVRRRLQRIAGAGR